MQSIVALPVGPPMQPIVALPVGPPMPPVVVLPVGPPIPPVLVLPAGPDLDLVEAPSPRLRIWFVVGLIVTLVTAGGTIRFIVKAFQTKA